jgi:hypothetical protein
VATTTCREVVRRALARIDEGFDAAARADQNIFTRALTRAFTSSGRAAVTKYV